MASDACRQVRVEELIRAGVLALNDGYRVRNIELGPFGIPFVRGGDIGDGGINTNVADRIRPEFSHRVQSKLTKPWDVAFITKGTVGRVGILRPNQPQAVFAPQVCYWRSLDHNRMEPRFLFYLLRSSDFQANLDAVKTHGSMAADYVSLSDQRSFYVAVPEIEEQRAIAVMLGTLDDRIELLRQTNTTLESIAQALFKAWFVDFDPVRAKTEGREPDAMDPPTAALFPSEFEPSEMGLIPMGWRVGKLGELCQNMRLQAKPGNLDSSTPYIGLEHMPRGSIALTNAETADGLASGKFWYARNDVLFGKLRPYFHKVGVASHTGVCSTDILVVRANEQSWFGYTTMHLSSDAIIEHATRLSNGAKMPRSSWSDLANYKVVIPPESLAAAFDAVVRAFVERIHINIETSTSLSELRDSLLPRLIAGKLRLPTVESVSSTLEESA